MSLPTSEQERKAHIVRVLRDDILDWPDMWCEVWLEGESDQENVRLRQMFLKGMCRGAASPEEADLIVFGGGIDVDPALYGEKRHKSVAFSTARDKRDMELYKIGFEKGIPMFGICRGAQFLAVMNGAKLYQDVNNHQGDHKMWLVEEQKTLPKVSSVHHQMVRQSPNMDVLGVACKQSTNRALNDKDTEAGPQDDIEAFFFRDTCCFGVQGHPEYSGYTQFQHWVLKKIQELQIENTDLHLNGRYRRIRPEIIERRKKATEKELA